MQWTKTENEILNELSRWEESLHTYEPTDFERTYDKWLVSGFNKIEESVKQRFFARMDTWLFHMHAFIQNTQMQSDERNRIITDARIFNEEIDSIEGMKELTLPQILYLSEQRIAKQRLLSFAQGGVSGSGGLLTLGLDLPMMAILNLKAVQTIAMTYGYEVSKPFEMMTSLKVFHMAALPKRMRGAGWENLKEDLKEAEEETYLYAGDGELTDETWFDQPLKQLLKALFILTFRKKLIQGIPLLGMALGASMNYQLSRQVTEFAHHFYQLRYLQEKEQKQSD
ncbi:EcsC family protein [Bacillus tianshenii]|nr:EcsC family protein [Bacillus tianshenii]